MDVDGEVGAPTTEWLDSLRKQVERDKKLKEILK